MIGEEEARLAPVKENVRLGRPLAPLWLLGGALAAAGALLLAHAVDRALPAPRPMPAGELFSADAARELLVNLTDIGPRVAGSYENEVLAVGVVVAALRRLQAEAPPGSHNRLEVDLHSSDGAFPLAFFDGMNNVYRGVQSVVARVSAAGGAPSGRPAPRRKALLLNCHFDTVPDSPGASDDGAGCAVVLETLRALLATRAPLRRDVIALFNGAEENIMQASHAFVTTHKWAGSVRLFVNIEACGAGGREVLFQAGPHDPWIMEVYAGSVPHPFASSLAQEVFDSGLVPADTDFRIFRDFGHLSGVDLAWSANGYVYHTALDTPDRIPAEALQRTGDNVLALARGLLASEEMDTPVNREERQPVFFDVLGQWVVLARPPVAAAAAAAALLLLVFKLRCNARDATTELFVPRGVWLRCVARALVAVVLAQAAGLLAAAAAGGAMHLANARIVFYATPQLLLPLYVLPGVSVTWWALSTLLAPLPAVVSRGWRGWGAARAAHDALTAAWALLLLTCALLRVRSGFCPLQWVLLPSLADLAGRTAGAKASGLAWWWALGALVPLLTSSYLALGCVQLLVPLAGRAGSAPAPDASVALLITALAEAGTCWLLPLIPATRHVKRVARVGIAIGMATALVLVCMSAASPAPLAYSVERPQRLMIFHTRRTIHSPLPDASANASANASGDASPYVVEEDSFFWIPQLDPNTPHSLDHFVPEMASAVPDGDECVRWPYCGAPYFLPVQALVAHGFRVEAPLPTPTTAVQWALHTMPDARMLQLNITGPSHVVVIVSPCVGCRLTWSNVLAEPRPADRRPVWDHRRLYFFTLHQPTANQHQPWLLQMRIERDLPGSEWEPAEASASVAVAGHDMGGAKHHAHSALLQRLPQWAHATGWPAHVHLFTV